MSTSYTIQLADHQRLVLLRALEQLAPEAIADIEPAWYDEGPADVIQFLKEGLAKLPEHEAKYPGTLYGFAL